MKTSILSNFKDLKTTGAGIIVALLTVLGQLDDLDILQTFRPYILIAGGILAVILIFFSFSSFTSNFDKIKDIFQNDAKRTSEDYVSQQDEPNDKLMGDVVPKKRQGWFISIFSRKGHSYEK